MKRSQKLAVLSAALWALPCAFSVAASKTIVFLGDSLTAGYGLAEDSAYPALIQNFLTRDGQDWNVVNAGISGDTTSGGLKRLPWVLKSNPTVVFVALGANDGLRGVKPEETRANLESIIRELKKHKIRVVLAGMELPVNYGSSYREKFRGNYTALAKKHSVALFPFLLEGVATRPYLNLADGIHPNEKGHEIMAANIYEFIKPVLKNE